MAHFKISTPGKVILYGEHAVVYGKRAIAASLDLRTTLKYQELENGESMCLKFEKVNLNINVPVKKYEEYFFNGTIKISADNRDAIFERVRAFVSTLEYEKDPRQKLSLEAFFYLLIYISLKEKINAKSFEIEVDTESTIGAGLGSSASFAVCLAACFFRLSSLRSNNSKNFDEDDLSIISKYAFECEKIMHGTPSGIDNSICTYGSVIEFKKDAYMRPISVTRALRILLVDTKVPRNTKTMVGRTAELMRKYPKIMEHVFQSIDDISKSAVEIIEKIQSLPEEDDKALIDEYDNLQTLVRMNQGLLYTCNASHPSLDKICIEAQNYGLAAKLTGAGGGGYAYILLYPDTPSDTITSITDKLIGAGYSVTLTSLGCAGVEIHV